MSDIVATVDTSTGRGRSPWYMPFLMFISGLGGLLAGVDYGIIGGALLYVDKTIPMTDIQQGFMVAIYVGGGIIASLFAGALAEWLGRKKMMLVGGLMFITSILLIYIASGFGSLLIGRILMGLSGGVICVVVPLFMAECLPSAIRGRGTAVFQFMMTMGFVLAAFITDYFVGQHDKAVLAAAGNADLIFKADDTAWRQMFLIAAVPGVFFSIGAVFLKESPRWLFKRQRTDDARRILSMSRSDAQTDLEIREMTEHSARVETAPGATATGTIFQRKYMVPLVIACLVSALTQATGIGSILSYGAKIMQGAGASAAEAATSLKIITVINCVVTVLAAMLVDKAGRKILMSIGTAGIVACLISGAMVFRQFEAKRMDVAPQVAAAISADGRTLSIRADDPAFHSLLSGQPGQLSVLYRYEGVPADTSKQESGVVASLYRIFVQKKMEGTRQGIAQVFSNSEKSAERELSVKPKTQSKWVTVDGVRQEVTKETDLGKLSVVRASYAPIASKSTGKVVTLILSLFIAFFAIGPGICVWLAMTELMPTRIRSTGMGVAMVLNTCVQFSSAFFLPIVVSNHGFNVMFFIWGGCTVLYFLTVTFLMPETKGKTLEEIEAYFENRKRPGSAAA